MDMQCPDKTIARMPWEQPYLEALIDHLKPSGQVLEVGFALGYSADRIQAHHPTHHTILEPDPEIAAKARQWANSHPAIEIIQEKWENALPKLGIFDSIFFNECSPEIEAKQLDSANLIIKRGRELIANTKTRLPEIVLIKYSDADLDLFFNRKALPSSEMANFLFELLQNGQISKEQYEKRGGRNLTPALIPNQIAKPIDSMMSFLKSCLKNHMRKGSRFSCFSSSPTSKFENPEFFEEIITNPSYDYEEKTIPIDVPESCTYYNCQEALLIVVEKQN